METWGQMASSVVPGLIFTVNFPDNHDSKRVPMLDFEVWKEEKVDPMDPGKKVETVKYSFFEKDVMNEKVMDRNSAIPHRMMIA